jgi:hypothetical protein
VAFAGALGVLLDIVMGGMLTFGLALAGAGVATVALALAGAGTGIATLTGVATMSRAGLAAFVILMSGAATATLAFREATVFAAVIGGISALAVAAAISHSRRGRHGAYAGAIGAIALITAAAVAFGWGHKPLVAFAACFFFLLPLIVGVVHWIAWGTTRSLFRGLTRRRRAWLSPLACMVLCCLTTAALMAALAFFLGFGAESYSQLAFRPAGEAAFALDPMIERAARDPFGEGLWLSLMLLTPLSPLAFFGASAAADALMAIQPDDYRLRRPLFRTLGAVLTIASIAVAIRLIAGADGVELAASLGDLGQEGVETARAVWNRANSAPTPGVALIRP